MAVYEPLAQHYDVTIIVPVKVPSIHYLEGFRRCYLELLDLVAPNLAIQLVIADDSPLAVFNAMERWFESRSDVSHFRPSDRFMTGRNNKLNSIEAALEVAEGNFIVILDDDYRPTMATVVQFVSAMQRYSCVKSMIVYLHPTLYDLIGSCGIFIVNLLHPHKQFCGHIGFRMSRLRALGFPEKDGLFDELVIELHFRRNGESIGFAPDVRLEQMGSIHGLRKYCEQRVRYAYENAAYPGRFVGFLAVLPTIVVATLANPWLGMLLLLLLSALSWLTALIGQIKFASGAFPSFTWLLAPLWFWAYPVATWIALVLYFRGGVRFGGRLIHRPV